MARKRVPKAMEVAGEVAKAETVMKMAEGLAKGVPSVPKDMEAGKAE
jgi:hypothetical protein